MPPQRRSQGPAPPHQPTPPRASNRQRVPTARAAAAAAPRGRGREVVGGDQAPPPPPPNDGPATGGGGRGAADTPTPPLPTMWSRRVGPTAAISKRKQQERQIENRIAGRTKPTIHDPRSAAAKEGIFGAAARGPAGDAARSREYEANKRMLDARARVEVRREEESLDLEEESLDSKEESSDLEEESLDLEEESLDLEEESLDLEEESLDSKEEVLEKSKHEKKLFKRFSTSSKDLTSSQNLLDQKTLFSAIPEKPYQLDNNMEKILRLLGKNSKNWEHRSDDGLNPLEHAVQFSIVSIVRYLLRFKPPRSIMHQALTAMIN
jgi:hypothetical protein